MLVQQLFEESFVKESVPEFIRKTAEFDDIICWDDDVVVIKDEERLTSKVLSTIYKQHTLKSFIRQLNMYDFKKVKRTQDQKYLCFKNEHFKKGHLEGLVFIKRKQRGYVQKNKLQNLESKQTLQRFNTYAFGILNKLKQQFTKLQPKFPEISNQLNNMIMTNIDSRSIIPTKDVYDTISTNDLNIQDFMAQNPQIPMFFTSLFSIPDFPQINEIQ